MYAIVNCPTWNFSKKTILKPSSLINQSVFLNQAAMATACTPVNETALLTNSSLCEAQGLCQVP